MKVLDPLDLAVLTADPAAGAAGDMYFNSALAKIRLYDGTGWVSIPGVGGGGGPNPTDAFSLKIAVADSNPALSDAVSFAFTFPETIAAQTDLLRLGLAFADSNPALSDLLLRLGFGLVETNPAIADAATFALALTLAESNAAPADAATLKFSFPESNPSLSDGRTSKANAWLSGSAASASGVTNVANANGSNDAAVATIQTVLTGSNPGTITSSCGSGIPAGVSFASAIFRGWFRAATTLVTTTITIVLHSPGALFADKTIYTFSGLNGLDDRLSGNFTYDLVANGIDTLAKLRDVQVIHSVTDAAAGVSPGSLQVDAGAIELTGVL